MTPDKQSAKAKGKAKRNGAFLAFALPVATALMQTLYRDPILRTPGGTLIEVPNTIMSFLLTEVSWTPEPSMVNSANRT